MNSCLFVVLFAFASVQGQIFAPQCQSCQRSPPILPNCPCGNQMQQVRTTYEVPLGLPVTAAVPRGAAKPCVENAVVPVVAEVPLSLPLGNPFLPAASPVSAMMPFSPLLPPANTCSRCQYLKKIPIPPPCI